MNRTVSLSQFMPYGAPDLIKAAPTDLMRAVVASSALAVTAFLLVLLIVPRLPKPVSPTVALRDWVNVPPTQPTQIPIPPPSAPPVVPTSRASVGVPLPVPEQSQPAEPPTTGPTQPSGPDHSTPFSDGRIGPPPPPAIQPTEDPPPTWHADQLPIPILDPAPAYPTFAQEAGVEGLVLVHVLVGKDGHVIKALVPEKYSVPMLDQAALAAARRWVFQPALTAGHPVAVWVAVPFRFSLH